MATDNPASACVYLGFAESLKPEKLFKLRSHYFPLGKVGGKPSWLSYKPLPTAEHMTCQVCTKPLCFLLQVYATHPDDPAHSFHRSLFLFVCRNPTCSQRNDASNIRAFRCQLPRINEYYSSEGAPDAELVGDVEPAVKLEHISTTCHICGGDATKKCAKCEKRWYCSKEHQAMHWKWVHKQECSGDEFKPMADFDNLFLFPEYGIEMDLERSDDIDGGNDDDDESSDDDDDDDECDGEQAQDDDPCEREQMAEYRKYLAEHRSELSGNGITEGDVNEMNESNKSDKKFVHFKRVLQRNPEQILRYERGGRPLWASDSAPVPTSVPDCELCGSSRQFEMQITPALLGLLGVDNIGHSIDWATVAVFTCSKNCQIPDNGYALEFVVKQDFQ